MSANSPHDSLFRQVFGRPAVAREHFHALLPAELVEQIDWATMAPFPGSTEDERFKTLRTDLVYQVATRAGEPLMLYLLFEHQRTPDKRMPLRIYRYSARIWDEWLKTDEAKKKPLPRIFPMVLYNGTRPWRAPTRMGDLFADDGLEAVFEPFLAPLSFVLQDLSQTSDEELTGNALRVLALLVLKHVGSDGFWEKFVRWAELVEEVTHGPGGLRAVEAVFRYGWSVAGEPAPAVEVRLWAALPSEVEELVVTWAERHEKIGEERGETQGELRTLRRLALVALGRHGELSDAMRQRVEAATKEELDQWLADALINNTITVVAQEE